MNLTYRQFEILVAAAEPDSFSAAAQRVGISQPALSEAIRRIEREIGARLFERTTRSLKLTAEGRTAAAVAREAVRDFRHALDDVAHLVCRSDHPLARRKRVRWRDLSGLPFVGITRISSVRRLTDAAFVHAEIAIEPRYEVEQIPSAIALVEAGLGVTALPSLTFSMFKGRNLAVRPLLEPRLRRNVGFVTFAGRTLPKHCDALMQAIRESLQRELRARKLRA